MSDQAHQAIQIVSSAGLGFVMGFSLGGAYAAAGFARVKRRRR